MVEDMQKKPDVIYWMKFWQNTDVEEAEVSVHMDIKN